MNWYLKALKQYADFSGRARRKECWIFYLINTIVIIAGYILAERVGVESNELADLVLSLVCIYFLGIFLPSLAMTVRRLHDIGFSGWWILIVLIPVIGLLIIFVLTFIDSENGENEWGANSKENSKESPKDISKEFSEIPEAPEEFPEIDITTYE